MASDQGRPVRDSRLQQIDRMNQQVVHLYEQGRYEQAIGFAEQARDFAYQSFGEGHLSYAISLNNLAGLYDSLDRHADAEPLYRRGLAISEATLGPHHPEVALSLNNLAVLY